MKVFIYPLMILLFQIISSRKVNIHEINSYFSSIILNISKSGYHKIFNEDCKIPDEIYINGVSQENKENYYLFNKEDNFIKLIWYNNIEDCDGIFNECCNITYIDLSEFNSSGFTVMNSMFSGCSSLVSLNLANFETSQVTEMNYMFYNCKSLISLNLSNFETSLVTDFESMFDGCIHH